jgi:HEAT repeat protein
MIRTPRAALAAAALLLAAAPAARTGDAAAQSGSAYTRLALAQTPPPAAFPQDPGDAAYRAAREALNRQDWSLAVRGFQRLRQQYPSSRYTPDALYWEAFARYRMGGEQQLRYALGALETQRTRYPRAPTRGDAQELATRIRGELARTGDAHAAATVTAQARAAAQCSGDGDEDSDTRIAALNALLQMDADQAMPLLRRVLARRDACSEQLRAKAVFLVSQKGGASAEQTLLDVVRTDPSPEVRGQAVFWLSQTGSPRAVDAIEEVLRTSTDPQVQEKAVFALSQTGGARADQLLRGYAERDATPDNVREKAIFWIGQHPSAENAAWLRGLYARLRDDDLKEKVLFSLSQMRGFGNDRWLLSQATDASQPAEVRKKALFWAAQTGVSIADIMSVYNGTRDQDVREQVIFALSQRGGEGIDRLIDIARRDPDRRMRAKAVFWLGQSNDPRATRVIQEVIDQ